MIHYLGDFLIFASPFTDEGCVFLDTVLGVLADLWVPVALNKLEGPGITVTFWVSLLTLRSWNDGYPWTSWLD